MIDDAEEQGLPGRRTEGSRRQEEPAPGQAAAAGPEPVSFRPSRTAFVVTFVAVVVAGLLGAAIGGGLAGVGCSRQCTTPVSIGAIVGALIAASGVAVVGVLVLRAMAEWHRQQAAPLVTREEPPTDNPPSPPTC